MPNNKPTNERTVDKLRSLTSGDMEAARREVANAREDQANEFLTELEERHHDAYDGIHALLQTAREAVEVYGGKRFTDWVAKSDEALDALSNINAHGAPSDDENTSDFVTKLNTTFELLIAILRLLMDGDLPEYEPDSRGERHEQVGELRDTAEELVKLLNAYIAGAEFE